MESGWNTHDGTAFAAPFAEDADYVVINGQRIRGRQIIDEGHQQIFDTVYKGSRNRGTIASIRFLRDDVAVAHVQWHLLYSQDDTTQEHDAMSTLVLLKENDRWQVTTFQNTRIEQPNY
jgi:uncharacterized protein (TIGR02246 family)